MNKLEIDIDTTKAYKALDSLQEKIKETQAQLDAMNAAMEKLTRADHDDGCVKIEINVHTSPNMTKETLVDMFGKLLDEAKAARAQ